MINIAICDEKNSCLMNYPVYFMSFFSQNIEIKICQFTNGSALLKSNKP